MVFPLAAAGFFEEAISESESSLLLSRTAIFPRLPFLAVCFFGKSASALSSPVDPFDEVCFFAAADFFAAPAVGLALVGCFFVDVFETVSSEVSFAC